MTTKFEQLLDVFNSYARALDRITRRKKRWDRERIKTVLAVGSAVLSGVAVAVPQARPVAVAVQGLQRATEVAENATKTPQLSAVPNEKETANE